MTITDFIAMIWTGQINYSTHFTTEGRAFLRPVYQVPIHADRDAALVEFVRRHQMAFFYLFAVSDTLVCSNPQGHLMSYVPAIVHDWSYTRCEHCARRRQHIVPTQEEMALPHLVDFERDGYGK